MGVQRARDRRKSVKYFRLTTHHLIIWTVIMRGYYAGHPPSLNDCLRSVTCAAETARKIIRTAHAKGYLEFRHAPSDQRKKLIYPSAAMHYRVRAPRRHVFAAVAGARRNCSAHGRLMRDVVGGAGIAEIAL